MKKYNSLSMSGEKFLFFETPHLVNTYQIDFFVYLFPASGVIWALPRENLSSGFPTKRVSNQSL